MMNHKQGYISVEALISTTVFIWLFSLIIGVFNWFILEEKLTQEVYEGVYTIEKYQYLYDKVGIFDFSIFQLIQENSWVNEINFLKEFANETLPRDSKNTFLKMSLQKRLNDFSSKVTGLQSLEIKTFDLSDERLNITIEYEHHLPFGVSWLETIDIDKKCFYFGDNASLYNSMSLVDFINKQDKEHSDEVIYVTKTGTKYHVKNCFYVVRSTTDVDKIIQMTIKQAKEKKLTPCQLCILKKGIIWK